MMNFIKLTSAVLMFIILTPTAVMASDTRLINNLKTCITIKKEAARLQCFDDVTKSALVFTDTEEDTISRNSKINSSKSNSSEINKTNTLIASTKLVDNQTKPLTAKQVDDFSKEKVKKTSEQIAAEVNTISLTISKLSKSLRGQWKIFFANGQQWQQKDNTNLRLKVGDEVQLSKGVLGSVFLKKDNTNKRILVTRLK
jgi:hypothetical protein